MIERAMRSIRLDAETSCRLEPLRLGGHDPDQKGKKQIKSDQ